MSNFGIGLGAFMGGVNQGMEAGERFKTIQDNNKLRKIAAEGTDAAKAAREADIGKSIKVGSVDQNGATVPTYEVDGQAYGSESEARGAAEKQVGSFMDYYTKTVMPQYQEHWMQTGQVDKAQAMQKWLENENVQKGVKSWANAVRSFQVGDSAGFKKNLLKAYNQQGYFDDGVTAEGIEDVKNDKGQLLGYKIKFKDGKGNVTEQTFDGEDVAKLGLNALSPAEVLSYGVDQLKQAQAARSELAKEGRKQQNAIELEGVKQGLGINRDNNKSALRTAEKAEELRLGTNNTAKTTSDTDLRKQLFIQLRKEGQKTAENNKLLGKNDPVFNDLPQEEQARVVEQQLQMLKRGNQQQAPVQSQGKPPVWRP